MARISRRTDTESSGQQYYDYNLLAVMILLTGFGLVMLYSVSSYTAQLKWGNDMYFFSRQAVISAAGLIIAIGISHIDYLEKCAGFPDCLSFRYNPGSLVTGNDIIGKPEEAKYGLTHDQLIDMKGTYYQLYTGAFELE